MNSNGTVRPVRFGGALIASAALLTASAAFAQGAEPICADRPGQTTPTCTVPMGMVQVETTFVDWTRDRDHDERSESISIGDATLKYGLTDRLDIELEVSPWSRSRTRAPGFRDTVSGFGDIGIAVKQRLTDESAPVQMAVRPFLKIPTAATGLGNDKVEGGILVPIGYAIPGSPLSLALGPQLEMIADGDGRGRHLAMSQVAGLGMPVTGGLSISADVAASWDWDPAGTVRQYSAGASAALLLSNDVQVDAGVNVGINRAAADLELYSGLAFRF